MSISNDVMVFFGFEEASPIPILKFESYEECSAGPDFLPASANSLHLLLHPFIATISR
jgi:hypothetical protein